MYWRININSIFSVVNLTDLLSCFCVIKDGVHAADIALANGHCDVAHLLQQLTSVTVSLCIVSLTRITFLIERLPSPPNHLLSVGCDVKPYSLNVHSCTMTGQPYRIIIVIII